MTIEEIGKLNGDGVFYFRHLAEVMGESVLFSLENQEPFYVSNVNFVYKSSF